MRKSDSDYVTAPRTNKLTEAFSSNVRHAQLTHFKIDAGAKYCWSQHTNTQEPSKLSERASVNLEKIRQIEYKKIFIEIQILICDDISFNKKCFFQ